MAKNKKIILLTVATIMLILGIKILRTDNNLLIPEASIKLAQRKDIILNNEINNILGYINFPKYNQKNTITLGTYEDILDAGYVGLHLLSEDLDRLPNNIILAAHNRIGLFQILENIQINDLVEIYSLTNKYTFKTTNIERVESNQMMNYLYKEHMRILTLITCIENNNKRLVITLEEI